MDFTSRAFSDFSFTQSLAAVRGGNRIAAFYAVPTPEEMREIYSRGYRGIRPESETPEAKKAYTLFMGKMPRLYDVFPWAKGLGKGKASCTYLPTLHFSPQFGGDEAQTRGSCTVHSTGNTATADYGADALFGETKWMGRLVKENIYRSRGFNNDGWSCRAPASYIGPDGAGGLLFRKRYEGPNGESVDFTKMNESWSGNGRAGVPDWLEEESRKNKAQWIIPIANMEEYRDAMALGFAISVCSGRGFNHSATDEYGVITPRGSWSHAMSHMACIDTEWARRQYGNMLGGVQQSWGKWIRQMGKPEGVAKVPVGMFFAAANHIEPMVRGGDSFAICNVQGWEREVDWEKFLSVGIEKAMQDSTIQDYYATRAERACEYAIQQLDESVSQFLAV